MALSDTPIKFKLSHTSAAFSNNLEKSRDAVMKDTNFSVPLVPVDYFKDHLLPRDFLSHFDVDAVVAKLRDANHINSNNRWKLFPEDPDVCHWQNEDSVFKPFALIAQYVATQARAVYKDKHKGRAEPPTQNVKWRCNPRMTPLSTNRHSTNKPDSYGVLIECTAGDPKSKTGVPHWDDVVVPGEKKKHNTNADFNDNNAKIIWSLHHGMRETVQRRFMFGYTIENTDMRLWFCSRADIIVSETFNFITDHRTLVHFFLSIMFAPLDKLGYDPTISVKFNSGDQKTNVYNIDVNWRDPDGRWHDPDGQPNKTTYVTTEVVANISAEALRGRGTRVWRGKQAGTNRKIVVKDCWIDSDRLREGDVFAEVLKAAEESSAEDLALFKKHFLTVVHHGDVFINGERDNTLSLHRNGADFPTPHQFLPLKRVNPATHLAQNPPKGLITMDDEVAQWMQALWYHEKSHYRIVFEAEEDCVPIDSVQSAFLIWRGMFGALQGAKVLHALGFVHRDLSAGNVLIGKGIKGRVAPGIGKIVDLEFCKRINDTSKRAHQGRTGTQYFIPVEVQRLQYQFGPTVSAVSSDSVDEQDEDQDEPPEDWSDPPAFRDAPRESAVQLPKQPAFFSNPIHDLESLWWLAIYLVFTRPVKVAKTASSIQAPGVANEGPANIEELDPQHLTRHWAIRLLVDYPERFSTLRQGFTFPPGTTGIHPFLAVMARKLNKARESLVAAYTKAEANIFTTGIDLTESVWDAHKSFEQSFIAILKDLQRSGNFAFEPMPTKFVLPSISPRPTATRSLDPSFALGKSKKRTHEDSQSDSKFEEGASMDEIARRMNALESPTRAKASKRSKNDTMASM